MYTTVFDVREQAFDTMRLIPLLFVFIGIGIVWFAKRYETLPRRKFRIAFGYVFGGIGLIVSLVMIPGHLLARSEARDIMKNKQYEVVQGLITDFHPMPKEGHEMESFTVNGIYFEYSDYMLITGFNNTASHGGPIRKNGQEVRLSYVSGKSGNRILKVEVSK